MEYKDIEGVPDFEVREYEKKQSKYCICIPIINERPRIEEQLRKMQELKIYEYADIIICDGNSNDGILEGSILKDLNVNTLIIKKGYGYQSAQFRTGLYWGLKRGYKGIIVVDGNNKDSMENIVDFISKLDNGYDFIQGSRFIKGGKAINTPLYRYLGIRLMHVPITSIAAGKKYTDTTNGYRAYSKKYLEHSEVKIFRDIFINYELSSYLSIKADKLKLKTCEIPVIRKYPKKGKMPTKISMFKGNWNLLVTLIKNVTTGFE